VNQAWGEDLDLAEEELEASEQLVDIDFDSFYRRELPAIAALLYALTGSAWAAEDLAADAFTIAFRHWPRIAGYERPGAFVRRVAINLARSRHKRLVVEARALGRLALGRQPTVEPLEAPDAAFWAQVRRLPGRQLEVVVLRYVEDLSVEAISEVLDCSPATVRVHLHRARTELARRLGADWGPSR